jgi:hypothetical protein
MKKTNLEPILLEDGKEKASKLLKKISVFKDEAEMFKNRFNNCVDGLEITFNKDWLKTCLLHNWEEKIGNKFQEFLDKQPKFSHDSLSKQFYNQLYPLEEAINKLSNVYLKISESERDGYCFPPELTCFDALPIDEDGQVLITDEYQIKVEESLATWVSTPEEFKVYNSIKAFFDAQESLLQIIGPFAAENLLRSMNIMGSPLSVFTPSKIDMDWYVDQSFKHLKSQTNHNE